MYHENHGHLADGTCQGEGFSIRIIPKYNNQGKTVGLLLHVLEPIFTRDNVVILDSAFCMLKGIVELKKCSVYASALIKKWKYWPKYIKGDTIRDRFNNKNVGDCDSWKGTNAPSEAGSRPEVHAPLPPGASPSWV